jgi:pyridoxal/pyridoxine/pyridoxamine kinase
VQGHSTEAALARAVSGVYAVLEETELRQSYEMALIASAAQMVQRDRLFEASALASPADTNSLQTPPPAPSR